MLGGNSWKKFASKKELTAERFEAVLKLLTFLDAPRPNPSDEIQFDWEWVAQHLCTPPYYKDRRETATEERDKHQRCKELVHEIRQRDIKFAPLLATLDKFERIALELDDYE